MSIYRTLGVRNEKELENFLLFGTKDGVICARCFNKGYYPAPNGEDDSDLIYCSCKYGEKIQEESLDGSKCIRCGDKDTESHLVGDESYSMCEVCHDDTH